MKVSSRRTCPANNRYCPLNLIRNFLLCVYQKVAWNTCQHLSTKSRQGHFFFWHAMMACRHHPSRKAAVSRLHFCRIWIALAIGEHSNPSYAVQDNFVRKRCNPSASICHHSLVRRTGGSTLRYDSGSISTGKPLPHLLVSALRLCSAARTFAGRCAGFDTGLFHPSAGTQLA